MLAKYVNIGYILLAASALYLFVEVIYRKILMLVSAVSCERQNMEKLILEKINPDRRLRSENRRYIRTEVNKYSIVKIINGGANKYTNVMVKNVSYVGTCLRTPQYIQPGREIEINMCHPLFPQPVSIKARVVRAETVRGPLCLAPSYDIGVEFLELNYIDSEKMDELMAKMLRCKKKNYRGVKNLIFGTQLKKSLTKEEAIKELKRLVSSKIDSRVLDLLLSIIAKGDNEEAS